MAKLAAVVDSLDAVPEPLRDSYTQADNGKFVLDIDVDAHPGTAGLKSKTQELIRRDKELSGKLKQFEGLDAEQARAALDAAAKAAEEKARLAGDSESRIKQLTEQHAKEKEKLESEIKKRDTESDASFARDEVMKAIVAEDGNPELLELLALQHVRVVRDEQGRRLEIFDKKGNTRYGTTGDEMTPKELMAEFRNKDSLKAAFNAPAVTGSGARSSTGRSNGANVHLTKEQAKDPQAYRRAKDDAAKKGGQVIIGET